MDIKREYSQNMWVEYEHASWKPAPIISDNNKHLPISNLTQN